VIVAVGVRSDRQKKPPPQRKKNLEALNQEGVGTMPDITTLPSYPPAQEDHDDHKEAIPSHPLGVKPSGNALLATWSLRDTIGSFKLLPDELILILLEGLDGHSLLRLGRTCKAFYAFTRAEEIWKALFVE
jgi:hypothetical protein